MRKFNFLFVLLFTLPILGFAQDDCENPDERRPICDPTFTRAEMTVHPIFDSNWEVTIDGKADEGFWSKIDPLDLPFDITDSWFTNSTFAAAPSADYEVSWKITYDEDFLYLFGEVTDDALVSRSLVTFNESYACDNIELFTLFAGPDVIMPDWALGDATQLRIYVDLNETTGDSLETGGFAAGIIGTEKYQPQGYKTKTVKTDKGYDVEVKIPFGLISGSFDDDDNYIPMDVKALTEFQFDINGADRDDVAPEAEREYIWGWSATWNRDWG
ncbi:MAG: sugar-binding protein, partial [Bacteroidota bacterium]